MAAYCRVYDSRHLQADCKEQGSAPEPYARQSSMGYLPFCPGGAMSRGAVVQSPSPPQPGLMHSLITGLYYKVTARKYGRTASVTLRAKRSVKRRTVRVKFARARTLVL